MIDRRFAWRVCLGKHANLSGMGGVVAANRWNSKGQPIVYLAEHPALAAYELVSRTGFVPPGPGARDWVLMQIDLGGLRENAETAPPIDALPQSRACGDAWIAAGSTAILAVPSVRVPFSTNLLLNPRHADADGITFQNQTFSFDPLCAR